MYPTAGRLLRGLAFMLHTCHTGQIIKIHVPGEENVMADVESRPEKTLAMFAPTKTQVSDADFCSSFDVAFPLPNKQEWALATVPEWLKLNVFETLRGKQLDLQQWTVSRDKNTGQRGRGTAKCTKQAAKEKPLTTQETCAVAVREGKYSLGRQIKVQSVSKALRAVAQKNVLDRHSDPRQSSQAQHSLDLPIAHLLKKFGDDDPPAEPKLAIPTSTVKKIAQKYHFSYHHQAVADLCIIAFFYLLQVGEYHTPTIKRKRCKRTIALRKCDIRLWCKGILLDPLADLATLLTADSGTICIENTKNRTKGAVVHHNAIGGTLFQVAALA
jgi:hypothetical protein